MLLSDLDEGIVLTVDLANMSPFSFKITPSQTFALSMMTSDFQQSPTFSICSSMDVPLSILLLESPCILLGLSKSPCLTPKIPRDQKLVDCCLGSL
jgi:hypothetical protein